MYYIFTTTTKKLTEVIKIIVLKVMFSPHIKSIDGTQGENCILLPSV